MTGFQIRLCATVKISNAPSTNASICLPFVQFQYFSKLLNPTSLTSKRWPKKASCHFLRLNEEAWKNLWDSEHVTFKDQYFHHTETSQLICIANQLTGFYMMEWLVVHGLKQLTSDDSINLAVFQLLSYFPLARWKRCRYDEKKMKIKMKKISKSRRYNFIFLWIKISHKTLSILIFWMRAWMNNTIHIQI